MPVSVFILIRVIRFIRDLNDFDRLLLRLVGASVYFTTVISRVVILKSPFFTGY